MPGRLAGKNAIITGAAGGIGLETSILMTREGASVLMTDASSSTLDKALARVIEVIRTRDGRVKTMVVDVFKEADFEAAVNHVDSWGGVDVMSNNAGIMHPSDGDAEECPDSIWDLAMSINVNGVWYGSKHAVRPMRKHGRKKGSVINTTSIVALVGAAAPQLAYTASKGTILSMTRELAVVHAQEKFRFKSLCPAPLNTPLLQEFLGGDKDKRFRREVHFPSRPFGEAIEQAQAAVFLASDESSFLNASGFVVDGGLTKACVTPMGPPTVAPRN